MNLAGSAQYGITYPNYEGGGGGSSGNGGAIYPNLPPSPTYLPMGNGGTPVLTTPRHPLAPAAHHGSLQRAKVDLG